MNILEKFNARGEMEKALYQFSKIYEMVKLLLYVVLKLESLELVDK